MHIKTDDNLYLDAPNVIASGNLQLGTNWFAPNADGWIRVLSDPNNISTYDKGLAAKQLYARDNIYIGDLDIGDRIKKLENKTQKMNSSGDFDQNVKIGSTLIQTDGNIKGWTMVD